MGFMCCVVVGGLQTCIQVRLFEIMEGGDGGFACGWWCTGKGAGVWRIQYEWKKLVNWTGS